MATDATIGRRWSEIRLARGAAFVVRELTLWASFYGAYLLLRSLVVADETTAVENGLRIVAAEERIGVAAEALAQDAAAPAGGLFGAYYMIGFAPVVAGTCLWLSLRRRALYLELRTALLVAIGLALVVHAVFPAAPPRLVGELGITDTVGLGGHDADSFLGVPFNPYAAMPSMHVGWSLLVALALRRALRPGAVRQFATLHPVVMAATVTATGNHYFLDSAAGVLVALTAVACIAQVRKLRLQHGADSARALASVG
jgi:hypothetical protein